MGYAIALRDDLPATIKPLLEKISMVMPLGGRALFSTTNNLIGPFIRCTVQLPEAEEPLVIDLPIAYITAIVQITDDTKKFGFIA